MCWREWALLLLVGPEEESVHVEARLALCHMKHVDVERLTLLPFRLFEGSVHVA